MKINRKFFCIFSCAVVIIPVSFITLDPADLKILFFLIITPLFLYTFLFKQFDTYKIQHHTKHPITQLAPVLFCAYVVYIFINWYTQSYPYYGNRSLVYHWICISGFLLGAFSLRNKTVFNTFLITLSIVLTIASLYALGEYFGYIPSIAFDRGEITGLVGHKNTFGFLMMAILPWNIYLFLSNKLLNKKQNIVVGVLFLFQFSALLLSDSRGSLVLCVIGMVAVALPILIRYGFLQKITFRIVLYGIISMVILLPVLLWNENTWIRIAKLFTNIGNSHTTRSMLYVAQWKLFQSNPLFGVGIGNFVSLNIPHWADWFRKSSAPFMLPRNGHCDYLETLCELGILGFVLTLFFWIGAIVLGIKQIRKQKDLGIYTHLVVLVLMMLHASFSTASRHIPTGILLWFIVGYFWRDIFINAWFSVSKKVKIYYGITGLTLHIIVVAFLLQIIVGDIFYLSFRKNMDRENKPVSLLQKSLKICPFHPNALFQTAYISLRTKEYDFALQCADQLDSVAPYLKPTYFIRGVCALNTGDYNSALEYANKTLYWKPNYYEAKVLKAKSLAKSGKCEELRKYKKLFAPRKKTADKTDTTKIMKPIPPNYDSLFIAQTGYLRSKFKGPFLRKSFDKMQHYYSFKGNEAAQKYKTILSLTCSSENINNK